jgi:hypothetical protein
MNAIDSLEFRVEVLDEAGNRIEELVALCSSAEVGKAAYKAALKPKPGANLVLTHRARVISRAQK